jgi:hypothetical protein
MKKAVKRKSSEKTIKIKRKHLIKVLWVIALVIAGILILQFLNVASLFSMGKCGDVNSDEKVTSADMIFLISYIFKDGNEPAKLYTANVNGDSEVSADDVVYLANYIFFSGPELKCKKTEATKFFYPQEEFSYYEKQLSDLGINVRLR